MGLLRINHKSSKGFYPPPKFLLCIIDWQDFFVHPESPAFISSAQEVGEKIKWLVEEFQKRDLPVIGTRHSNSETEINNFLRFYGRVISRRSKWFNLAEPLKQMRNLKIIDKDTYSVFENHNFTDYLLSLKISKVILVGVQTDKCILASALSGFDRGFEMMVLSDACLSRIKYRHSAALKLMKSSCAAVMKVNEFINLLDKEI
ncbi:MAG: isochorismatase family cysteine hydrolase [Candidatus Saccharicenans sp.]|nr:isochorismatase family cysteine hydrolase [Candidatus Saccharicenans sp.]